jgi:hypothetical protein
MALDNANCKRCWQNPGKGRRKVVFFNNFVSNNLYLSDFKNSDVNKHSDKPAIVQFITKYGLLIWLNFLVFLCFGADPVTPYSEVWELNSLKKINGHDVKVFGNPEVVKTETGKAIRFDGIDDRLLVNNNPLGDAKEFTIEVIFKPDSAYNISRQPRFIHFQDEADTLSGWNAARRIMMELRLTPENKWYLDGFLLTDAGERTLANKNLIHSTGQWCHAALTYKDNTFKTYVNGVEETGGSVMFTEKILNPAGKVSIGGRMNRLNYYCGLIKTLKITRKALMPQQFIKIIDKKKSH